MPDAWIPWLAGLFGLALGSFLNVCTLRWPRDLSVVTPRSRCPRCETPISGYDNLPVVSWLLLRGRCRHCSLPISVQYPLVELSTALVWAGAFWLHGAEWEALRAALFLTLLLGIAVSDARFYIIPDQFSLGGAILGLALAFAPGGISWQRAVIGAVGGYLALWLVGVGGTWLVRTMNPARLDSAFEEHDETRADETVRARVARVRTPPVALSLVGFTLVLAVVAGVIVGTGGFLVVAAAGLAAVAVLLAWAEAFDDPIFAVDEAVEADVEPEPATALGGGDIRMMAMVGAFLGLPGVLLTVLGGSVLALLGAIPLTLAFKQLIPLGIFLAFAGAAVYLGGDAALAWYFGLMGL